MSSTNRLKTYTALAVAPCAALGGIAAETHAAPGQVPVTAQLTGEGERSWAWASAFTAADLRFQAIVFYSTIGSSGGITLKHADRNGPAGQMRFFGVESSSQVISWSASYDKENSGYGGRSRFDYPYSSGRSDTFLMGTGVSGTGFMGFAVQNTETNTYVAGWVELVFDYSGGSASSFVTINSWAFNTGDVTTSITMPGTAVSGAVPGVGGLAGLAMGAAGLRRKRQRAA